MSRLTPDKIHSILVAYNNGDTKSAIAEREQIDVSTVRHHIRNFENVYGSTDVIYTVVKSVQRVCNHPSLKCLVCGVAHDTMHRHEVETIQRLESKLSDAAMLLSLNGIEFE